MSNHSTHIRNICTNIQFQSTKSIWPFSDTFRQNIMTSVSSQTVLDSKIVSLTPPTILILRKTGQMWCCVGGIFQFYKVTVQSQWLFIFPSFVSFVFSPFLIFLKGIKDRIMVPVTITQSEFSRIIVSQPLSVQCLSGRQRNK